MKKLRLRHSYVIDGALEQTAQGFVRASAIATRTGVFKYLLSSGKTMRQLRLPEEVFNPDSLATLASVPLTNEHPDYPIVSPENAARVTVGYTGENVEAVDNKFLKVSVTVIDKNTIDDIKSGKNEVSCGYVCELEENPGVFEGEEYDVIQRKIRYNHLALVDKARGGKEIRLQLDSDEGVQVENDFQPKEKKMKITIGGQEFDVSDEVGAAVKKLQDELAAAKSTPAETEKEKSLAAELDSKKEELTKTEAKVDGLTAEITKLKAKNDSATPDVKALVKARKKLEAVADSLGVEKYDDMDDLALKKAVIMADSADAKLDGQNETYVNVRFDMIAEKSVNADSKAKKIGENLNKKKVEVTDSANARQKSMDSAADLWKQPLSVTK